MTVTDAMRQRAEKAIEPWVVGRKAREVVAYAALEAVFAEIPDPEGEVCDGDHEGPCPAWHDGVDGLRQRIAELETRLAQAAETERHLRAHRAPLRRIAELETQLATVRAAWKHDPWQPLGTISAVFEGEKKT